MKCRICRKEEGKVYIKGGRICLTCLRQLPPIIKENNDVLLNLTFEQINKIKKIVTNYKSPALCSWEGLYICADAIQVNSWEIKLKNIKQMDLNFHPKAYGTGEFMVRGSISIIVETTHPHVKIEDVIIEDKQIEYRIAGKEIKYIYPKNLVDIIVWSRKTISEGTFEMKTWWENKKKAKKGTINKNNTEFDKAKRLFKVDIPYTEAQIRAIRNVLIKENHPDEGGSAEKCAEINKAYELLEKFAKG